MEIAGDRRRQKCVPVENKPQDGFGRILVCYSPILAPILLTWIDMDRKITKKRFPIKLVSGILVILSSIAFFSYQMLFVDKKPTVYAKNDELLLATITMNQFQEYVNITGIMAPGDSLYLDALEGGQVKEIFVDVGDTVKKDTPILSLENTDLEMDELLKKARILEKKFELQRARVNCNKLRHQLKEDLFDLEFRLTRFNKDYQRNHSLAQSNYISGDTFEEIADSFHYWKEKRTILIEAMGIEEQLHDKTIKQIEAGLALLKTDFKKTRKRLDDLMLTAPVTGLLTTLDASVGETKNKGERIGQIDLTDQIKVIARVDEFYAGRVLIGNTGTLEVYEAESNREATYNLKVTTISPEVKNNEFEVEFVFAGTSPETIRLGQSFTVRLGLGRQYEALVLKKGPFVQTSGGSWVYVLDEGENKGVRRAIKIGKHNPDYFEVLGGLKAGEKVIISAYDNYQGVESIELN